MRCPSLRKHSNPRWSTPARPRTARRIRRRRECLDCGRRFTTYEALQGEQPACIVTKADGLI